MTQEQLGQRLHVSAQAVSKWENGESSPDISLVVRLANILGCTTDFMLGNVCTMEAMLPQIKVELRKMTHELQNDFLGDVIDTIGQPISSYDHALDLENSALPAIHLGPTGLGVWARGKFACFATTAFLTEANEAARDHPEFPMNILPQGMLEILFELLPDNASLQPEFTVAETVLRARLPDINFDEVILSCIEMGFVDKVRGGYRLNVKADVALRLFAVVHRVVSKPGCTSFLYARSGG